MLTLNKILKKEFTDKKKKIPSDLVNISKKFYYSESKEDNLEYGKMEISHLIRVFNKLIKTYISEERQKELEDSLKWEKFEKWLQACPINYDRVRHPSSELKSFNFYLR